MAGAILIVIQPVEPSVARDYIGRVFAICVLGGLGSFAGTVVAAMALGVSCRRMPSGGGHDAAAFAQAGVPAGMLFVRNQNGSHNPHEAMRMEDFAAACAVLTRWAAEAAG